MKTSIHLQLPTIKITGSPATMILRIHLKCWNRVRVGFYPLNLRPEQILCNTPRLHNINILCNLKREKFVGKLKFWLKRSFQTNFIAWTLTYSSPENGLKRKEVKLFKPFDSTNPTKKTFLNRYISNLIEDLFQLFKNFLRYFPCYLT